MQGWDYLLRAAELGSQLKVWRIQRDALLCKQHAIACKASMLHYPLVHCSSFGAGDVQSCGRGSSTYPQQNTI